MIAVRGQKALVHDRADDVDVGVRKCASAILARDCFLNLENDLFEFVEVHEISVAKKRIFSIDTNEVSVLSPAHAAPAKCAPLNFFHDLQEEA